MENLTLTAEGRTELGTRRSKRLRQTGYIPCVLYSKKGEANSLMIKLADFDKVLKKGSRLIELKHPSGNDKVFIKEVQYDHLGEKIVHIDFNKIALDELITLEIPVVLKGKPAGVLEEGGVLDQYVKTVKISCLPTNIPTNIEVDVSGLKLNQNLQVKDIKPPEGVKIKQEPDIVVATVTIHIVEEVAPVAAELSPTEPELIKKEKVSEEETEGEAPKGAAKETTPAGKEKTAPQTAAPPAKEKK